MVTADPVVVVLVLACVRVDLLAELTVPAVVVVLVAGAAKEAVLVLLHLRPDLLVDLLAGTQLVEALATRGYLLPPLL